MIRTTWEPLWISFLKASKLNCPSLDMTCSRVGREPPGSLCELAFSRPASWTVQVWIWLVVEWDDFPCSWKFCLFKNNLEKWSVHLVLHQFHYRQILDSKWGNLRKEPVIKVDNKCLTVSLVAQMIRIACNAGVWGSIPGWGWLPTPVFLPGKSHGQRSLLGYSPWGCKKSRTWLNKCLILSLLFHFHSKWHMTNSVSLFLQESGPQWLLEKEFLRAL